MVLRRGAGSKKRVPLYIWGLSIVMAACLVSCATTTGTPVSVLRPAEIDLAKYERVAVGQFTGKNGNLIAQELTQALMESNRFEVLDRANMNAVLNEQKFGQTGLVHDDTAAGMGSITGTAVLIMGNVNDYHFNEPVEKNEWRDSQGYYHVSYTRSGQAHVEVFFKVLDAKTSKVIASKTLDKWKYAKRTGESPPPRFDTTSLYAGCREQIVTDFMKVIAPYTDTVFVPLFANDKIGSTEMGKNSAKLGKWGEAKGHFETALAMAESDPKLSKDLDLLAQLHCNVGLAHLFTNEFADAKKEFETAYTLSPKDTYLTQIQFCDQREAECRELQSQVGGSNF